jgi:hypothetical protein
MMGHGLTFWLILSFKNMLYGIPLACSETQKYQVFGSIYFVLRTHVYESGLPLYTYTFFISVAFSFFFPFPFPITKRKRKI